jgi:hypothetical protein
VTIIVTGGFGVSALQPICAADAGGRGALGKWVAVAKGD